MINSDAKLKPAGLLRVMGCILYDALLLSAVLFVSTLAFLAIPASIRDTAAAVQIGKMLWYFGLSYLYFVWSWQHGGQTPGMKAWRTHLTDCAGNLPSNQATIKRFFAALLSWLLAGTGFLWMIVDKDKRSLHDRLSGTCLAFRKKP
ncbi:MAG TPA: RDD family protein [Gammaproteobacteria bacterium]|nr:RDD family protein [Gammaproteobacteria bacterium]